MSYTVEEGKNGVEYKISFNPITHIKNLIDDTYSKDQYKRNMLAIKIYLINGLKGLINEDLQNRICEDYFNIPLEDVYNVYKENIEQENILQDLSEIKSLVTEFKNQWAKKRSTFSKIKPHAMPANKNNYAYVLYRDTKIKEGTQLDFRNRGDQSGYFQRHSTAVDGIVPSVFNCAPPISMTEKMITFRLPLNINTILTYDYCSVLPNGGSDITTELYCRIVERQYVAYLTTEITVEIDWFQSAMFTGGNSSTTRGWELGECFIERKLDNRIINGIGEHNPEPEPFNFSRINKIYEEQLSGTPSSKHHDNWIVVCTTLCFDGRIKSDGQIEDVPVGTTDRAHSFKSGATHIGESYKPYFFYMFPYGENDYYYPWRDYRANNANRATFNDFLGIVNSSADLQTKIISIFQTGFTPFGYYNDTSGMWLERPEWLYEDMLFIQPREGQPGGEKRVTLYRLNSEDIPTTSGNPASPITMFYNTRSINVGTASKYLTESKTYNEPFTSYTVESFSDIMTFDITKFNNPANATLKFVTDWNSDGADTLVFLENYANKEPAPALYNKGAVFKTSYALPYTFDNQALLTQANKLNREVSWADYQQNNVMNVANATPQALSNAISGGIAGATIGSVGGPVGAAVGAVSGAASALIPAAIGAVTGSMQTNYDVNKAAVMRAYESKLQPLNVSNVEGDIFLTLNKQGLYLSVYTGTPQELQNAKHYFSIYGYAYNRKEIPNLRSHIRFDFYKLALVTVKKPISQYITNYITTLFRAGLHIFHVDSADENIDINFNNNDWR